MAITTPGDRARSQCAHPYGAVDCLCAARASGQLHTTTRAVAPFARCDETIAPP